MNISILTLFPDLYTSFLGSSLIGRARKEERVAIETVSLFDFSEPKKRIDAPTFGPGPGMLIKPEIVEKAISASEKSYGKAYRIFFSPHGKKLDQDGLQALAKKFSEKKHIMFVCPRYEGLDARVEQYYADEVISIGDYVLMGGDLPAMVTMEGFLRYLPGVVGKDASVEQDSFSGPFVDFPHYTEPVEWKGMKVPDVIRSGNHAEIEKWREEQAAQRTAVGHFDWARSCWLTDHDKKLLRKNIPSHYVALLHSNVLLRDGQAGTTSVTSLDLHDIARSARTYGMERYFIVTPLQDQQKMVRKMLDFWKSEWAITYNPHRHEAVERVELVSHLDAVIDQIEKEEGKKPLIIATSAREPGGELISYYDQEKIWKQDRPVLFLLGTGGGISPELVKKADFTLLPIEGLTDFNHLSVRSAAAVILDRWLGISPKK